MWPLAWTFQWFHLLPYLLLLMPILVTARFCEGGHICSLPRECCTQGCCPPYQGGPRQLPPPSEHVLNLFFISHWFFWCVVLAVILALLCAYSLWKKRRTLCGWGFTEHQTQSEGDSAGSCFAPPQYSRCNSFHHPPPPYTEVTSKPDLYPLVFTCNNDNSKGNGGSSYLMVQYFRNYIIRPAGSLSAASTVDSLSSSFICNANEANTLVPPPYSRAASPELSLQYGTHREPLAVRQYGLSRSASQFVEMEYQPCQIRPVYFATGQVHYNTRLHNSLSEHFSPDAAGMETTSAIPINDVADGLLQSHSDQRFLYKTNTTSSLSTIFVNNFCPAGLGDISADSAASRSVTQRHSLGSLAKDAESTPVIYNNPCIQPNPLENVMNSCQISRTVEAATTVPVPETTSGVSEVNRHLNIGTPLDTSPSGVAREILGQTRQLQASVSYEHLMITSAVKPRFQNTASLPTTQSSTLKHHPQSALATTSAMSSVATPRKCKKTYASKSPKSNLSIPMVANDPPFTQRYVLKSSVSSVVCGASFIINRGRVARKGWISHSAPSTPGSVIPSNRLGDDSPLLNEHDEDAIEEAHGDQQGQR